MFWAEPFILTNSKLNSWIQSSKNRGFFKGSSVDDYGFFTALFFHYSSLNQDKVFCTNANSFVCENWTAFLVILLFSFSVAIATHTYVKKKILLQNRRSLAALVFQTQTSLLTCFWSSSIIQLKASTKEWIHAEFRRLDLSKYWSNESLTAKLMIARSPRLSIKMCSSFISHVMSKKPHEAEFFMQKFYSI